MGVLPLPRPTPTHPPDRVCAEEGCDTRLSIYNAWKRCWQHEPRHRVPVGQMKGKLPSGRMPRSHVWSSLGQLLRGAFDSVGPALASGAAI